MISAENLNLDVLGLIFDSLTTNDLCSLALVSQTFFSAVLPRLYSKLFFRNEQASCYPEVISPFTIILAHPEYATHVRAIDIRAIPKVKPRLLIGFRKECIEAMHLCTNLVSFKCTVKVSHLLPLLENKSNLREIMIPASLTTEQANNLLLLDTLQHVFLCDANWKVTDVLPKWSGVLSATLTTLTLYMCQFLNGPVLESVIVHLPRLTGLHIVRCQNVTATLLLRLLTHLPLLESFAMSTSDQQINIPPVITSLRHLRFLALDIYDTTSYSALPSLSSTMRFLKETQSHLSSFCIRRTSILEWSSIEETLNYHGSTLENLSFLWCKIDLKSITAICNKCPNLTHLELPFPMTQFMDFVIAIKRLPSLCVLINTRKSADSKYHLMRHHVLPLVSVCPSLKYIISDNREWTRGYDPYGRITIELKKHRPKENLWFMPHK
ncbi:hypothetical protein AMATHDRAFT_3315 [Amanita thiersii Skay4041]|uniref:F-box domain-containing protein n=1 Tax=Amanita thiersii Skay4041 TaxID=703135 RepID=A0A2A9NPD3_9AGAR|nr:hypothetical protein AMATHDRAFT_3315 [Amanita thiersii Skay4041]